MSKPAGVVRPTRSSDPMRVALVVKLRFLLASLLAFAWVGACLDEHPLVGPIADDTILGPLIVSNPVRRAGATAAATRVGAALSIAQLSSGDVVYVSLLPGTIPEGGLAIIRNPRTSAEVPAAMADGGFDPVAIEAVAGDTLIVDVEVDGDGFAPRIRLAVLAARRPVVVRTDPPPKKRDVPLNTPIVVVFSEPITSLSVESIRVLHNGAAVSGSVTVTADGLRAVFESDQALAPNTEYALSIPTSVSDLDGEALAQAELVEFTTGSTAALANVFTEQAALFTVPTGALRAFNMNAVLHDNGSVTGFFSIFYPEFGIRATGRVTCFTIVDRIWAWVGGVVEDASNPDWIGQEYVWRAADNGLLGSGVPDQLSFAQIVEPAIPGSTTQEWCATTPLKPPGYNFDLELHNLLGGGIVISGTTRSDPPPPPPAAGLSQIAYFVGGGGIHVMHADGSAGWPVTSARNDANPSWSPDGAKLAFQSDRDQQGNWEVYVINWDRTGLRRLTTGPETDLDPAWSPDGTKIAFLRNGSIHVMNAEGSGVTRLSLAGFDSHPSWSPDGSRIVFASSRTGVNAIHVMNADGSGVVQLTSDSAADYSPSWSPDGSKIVFQRRPFGVGSIYVMNPDGTGLTRVVVGQTPSWSPDGRRIIYEMFGINSVMVDGSGLTQLGTGFAPNWSRVGTLPPEPVPFRSVEKAGGDGQTGTVGTRLAQPLSVRLVRDDGTPQPSTHIDWTVWGPGQPSVGPVPSITDSNGVATMWLTLGSLPGVVGVRAARVDGTARIGEVIFTATAVP